MAPLLIHSFSCSTDSESFNFLSNLDDSVDAFKGMLEVEKTGSDNQCRRQNLLRISRGKEPLQFVLVVNATGSSTASIASLDNL
ncbi:hypothetical protein ACOSQ3_011962 [Xanthoceras sorbifolium]